ncbi:hypothetical protein [Rhodoferax sp.]|uniref:hypothetical protein n=1 Tax=Rhodoferax sp. TaxID=50421 RepID=UPI003BB705DC
MSPDFVDCRGLRPRNDSLFMARRASDGIVIARSVSDVAVHAPCLVIARSVSDVAIHDF